MGHSKIKGFILRVKDVWRIHKKNCSIGTVHVIVQDYLVELSLENISVSFTSRASKCLSLSKPSFHLYVLKYSSFYYNVLFYPSGTLSLWHFDRQNEYSNLHEILNTSSWTFCGPITNSENRKSCNTNIFSNHFRGFLEVFGFFYRVL